MLQYLRNSVLIVQVLIEENMPKISAVMALYNTPYSFLQATVESILSQTFVDFELIIVDDASQMKYQEFLDRFKDERIKYFKLDKNAGPGHARNEGIKKAVGEYVAIVDSDDVYLPKRFEVQAEFLDRNLDISLVSCAFKQSNNGKIPTVIEDNEDIKVAMLFNSPLANPAVMFRRETFVQQNLFYPESINFAEDYQLWLDAMFCGLKMVNLRDVLMIYTRREGQLSKTKSDTQSQILKDSYKKIFIKMGLNFSLEELDLHYNLAMENFSSITDLKEINSWFEKIINQNKVKLVFCEQKLVDMQNRLEKKYLRNKNRLVKIKIGNKNFCISKQLKIYIEKRD